MAVSRVEHIASPNLSEAEPASAEPLAARALASPIPGLAFPIQLKVAVGSASDPAELEAERVAASVVGLLRRSGDAGADDGAGGHDHGSDCGHDHGLEVQRRTDTRYEPFPIRRHAGHDHAEPADEPARKKKKLQRVHDGADGAGGDGASGETIGMAGGDLSAHTEQALSSASSGGQAIDASIRGPLEGALGADLSGVRLHAGPQAAQLNQSMSAQAFTHGNNVFFRDGMPDTNTDAGLHLLSHELTHTVQQGAAPARRRPAPVSEHTTDDATPGFVGAIGGIRRSTDRPLIRRHAAFEHYMLGQLPPRQLGKIPAVRAIKDNKAQAKNVKKGKGGGLGAQDTSKAALDEVLHLIDMEMERLWRYKANPEALSGLAGQKGKVTKGMAAEGDEDTYGMGKSAQGPRRDLLDTEYNVPIVVLTCANQEEVVVSYSEMNTMPDLFGNPEAIEKTSKASVLGLLQGVRQQLYIELSNMRDELSPKGTKTSNKLANKAKMDGDFDDAAGPRAQAVVDKVYEIHTEMAVNKATEREGDEHESYFSALERNACHFAPQSWSQWQGYHEKALELAGQSADFKEIAEHLDGLDKQKALDHSAKLANQAMIQNSFGEHYLQDSFAAGHLIDKTKIMQWFALWLDSIGHNLGSFEAAQVEWAMALYAANQKLESNPQALHDSGVRGEFVNAKGASDSINMKSSPEIKFMMQWRDKAKATPKLVEMDPDQAALELGVGRKAATVHFDKLVEQGFASKNRFGKKYALKKSVMNNKIYDVRVITTGNNPMDGTDNAAAEFNLASYKALMSNAYIGSSTKFFHDMFCKEGLEVETSDDIAIGRIYGDSNMMNAGAQLGLEWSAETARMSRDSIFDSINGVDPGITTGDISKRFPRKVKVPGTQTVLPIVDFNLHLKAAGEAPKGLFSQAQTYSAKLVYKTVGLSKKGAMDMSKLTGLVEKQKTLLDESPW
jgi:hypothetical protein